MRCPAEAGRLAATDTGSGPRPDPTSNPGRAETSRYAGRASRHMVVIRWPFGSSITPNGSNPSRA